MPSVAALVAGSKTKKVWGLGGGGSISSSGEDGQRENGGGLLKGEILSPRASGPEKKNQEARPRSRSNHVRCGRWRSSVLPALRKLRRRKEKRGKVTRVKQRR